MALPITQSDVTAMNSLAEHFVKSGYFKDVNGVSKAVVKMTYGRELGLGPGESLQGIYFVDGKLTLAAHTMGAMIQRHPNYDYKVLESSNEECTIQFFDGDISLGVSQFTIGDAKRAELTGKKNWRLYPKAMLFSRAMSQGCRMYCPTVFGGPVYSEGEIEEPPGSGNPQAVGTVSARRDAKPYKEMRIVTSPEVVGTSEVGNSEQADSEPLAVESVGAGKGAPAFLNDEPLPENREDDEADGLTAVKEVFDAQVVSRHGIPVYEDDDPVDPPTEKQMNFIETLLVHKGVQTRHVPDLIQECLDGNVNKETVRNAISDIKDRPMLPAAWCRAYVKMARVEKKLSIEQVMAHLAEEYDVKDPAEVAPGKQRDVYDWINNWSSEDNSHEFGVKSGELSQDEMNWLRWVDAFCTEFELPENIATSYIQNKFGDVNDPEVLAEIKAAPAASIYRAIRSEYLTLEGQPHGD